MTYPPCSSHMDNEWTPQLYEKNHLKILYLFYLEMAVFYSILTSETSSIVSSSSHWKFTVKQIQYDV